MIPVILSGGSGTRLWPLSRTTYPKQFLPMASDQTLFQETLTRLPQDKVQAPIIVCNNEHRFLAAHQMQDLGIKPDTIILEPIGRNTAPAIAIAALHLIAANNDGVMLILPADHVIKDHSAFAKVLLTGASKAEEGKVVTFGVVPDQPHTGYGYIKAASTDVSGADIVEFKEKPDVDTAVAYIESGDYYWNSGMFMFKASVFINELEQHAPDILAACKTSFKNITKDLDFLRLKTESFGQVRSESIDYAVMEKTEHAFVIPLNAGWNDLGAWSSVLDVKEKNADGNVLEGDIFASDCKGSYLYSDNKIVAAIGLEDMVIIDTLDAVLVAPKDRVQDVKNIVEKLKADNRSEAIVHRLVHRPWGTYDGVDTGDRHQVKRITVYPGQKLSVQRHQHRAEHWIVVKGTAKVTCDEKTFIVKENESTYIPVGSIHSLENPNETLLELIEVQSGDYLGEDDIERFEDRYGRE